MMDSNLVYRHGQNPKDQSRFRCRECRSVFQLTYTFSPRADETCRELLALLTPFNIGMITSDDWGSYRREVSKDNHLTGKIFTQRIERNNLTLGTRIKRLARKTICFSRSIELHEKVIGPLSKNTCSTNWHHYQILKDRIEAGKIKPTS
ncbi:Insertion element iso-IS1n protein insB [Yersinia pseudotuberculosis]|nr:Insertion element iso-IS1n protein insB [Yersinia pseudotuberculosis]CNL45863.1 Insertion element iso-IS1n protein insB [Yersinia pseudotuberculosis]CRY72427.1 Insertion element iso-IS1n protein insB [Yersinia pseudotuberculosis]SUB30714.1 Transposase and inactivated derivatives [Yersinia pseudotuberculosis]SUP85542.1 Insertion element iso-IS1n protein insB [Yersinia pseudotuberculosis]